MRTTILDAIASFLVALINFAILHWPAVVLVAVALLRDWKMPAFAHAAMRRLDEIAQRPLVPAVSIATLSLLTSTSAVALHGIPLPRYHDDFAYLLGADFFRHGRLAFPAHPFGEHFQTMLQLQQPVYASQYPPLQSLLLALGIFVFGNAAVALWLTAAASCVATWWALRGWIPARLAMVAGMLMAIHPTMFQWSQRVHGGQAAVLAGALLLGACGRLALRPTRAMALLAALALVLLAACRPYEGAIYAIAVLVVVMPRWPWKLIAPFSIPSAALLASGLFLLGCYDRAITGSFLVHPHQLYDSRFLSAPNFLWGRDPGMPHEPNAEMDYNYRVVYRGQYLRLHAAGGLAVEASKKIGTIGNAVFGEMAEESATVWPLLLLPLLGFPRALTGRGFATSSNGGAGATTWDSSVEDREPSQSNRSVARSFTIVLLLFAFAPFSITWWLQLHYLACAAAVAAGLCVVLLASMASLRSGWLLLTITLAVFLFNAGVHWLAFASTREGGREVERRGIEETLAVQGGDHVIMVPPAIFDVVFNGADIDHQRVIWARELGRRSDAALLRYYRGRRVWRLGIRDGHLALAPY